MKKIYLLLLAFFCLAAKNFAQNTCATAIPITSIPFSSGAQTTCGTVNDYAAGSYFNSNYGDGEDFVYSINITTAPVAYNFALAGAATWKIASVHTALNITSAEQKQMDVIITDVTGRIVAKEVVNIISGFNAIEMNVSKLAAGTYQLHGQTVDSKTRVLQFVKQ